MATQPRADHPVKARRGAPSVVARPTDALVGQPARLALIEQSHQRCAALGLSRIERPDYEPLMRSDLVVARERNQRLSNRAAPVMEMLLEQIVNTHSMIVLTDAQGTVLHTVGDNDFLERANQVALAPGANWAEHSKGTNAIGTALFAETPTLVHAGEHFMHANSFLTCSAAPIFDPRGNMLGVLDVTGDQRSYHQHTMGLVRMSARMIENHWLTDDYSDRLRLHFHPRSEFIGTLLEGIAVVDPDGRMLGANRGALDQLGLSMPALRSHSLSSLFGTSAAAVIDHLRQPLATPMQLNLPDGRLVYASAHCSGPRALTLRSRPPSAAAAGAPRAASSHPVPTAMPVAPDPRPPVHGSKPAAAQGLPESHSGLAYLQTGDPAVESVVHKLRRVLNRDIPILLLGETGTGKELLARAIHHDSQRAKQPFVVVNCAGMPESLVEAALFGCEDGAVSGARRQGSHGRIVQADGGTLFLDEVGDLPLTLQARLLHVLQARSVTPPGSHRLIPVDIAVIAATSRRLRDSIDRGAFREDLYHCLNGLAVRLPPLRERQDLPAIAHRMLSTHCPPGAPEIGAAVMQRFLDYPWPGNLRELNSVLRTAVLMATGEARISTEHLPDDLVADAPGPAHTLQQAEAAMIQQALDTAGGNISEAAKRLGISRNTVYRKLRGKVSGSGRP